MATMYTSTGEYIMRRNSNGFKYPVVVLANKAYQLSVPEMILWTKGMWNTYSHELLKEAFGKEEKMLGEMNFNFTLNRLLQRGLMLSGEADSDVGALHTLIDRLIIKAADVSLFSQIKMFFTMFFLMNIPFKHAKTLFKKYDLTEEERTVLCLTKDKNMTTGDLFRCLDMDDTSALMLVSNLYLKKLIRFLERGSVAAS